MSSTEQQSIQSSASTSTPALCSPRADRTVDAIVTITVGNDAIGRQATGTA